MEARLTIVAVPLCQSPRKTAPPSNSAPLRSSFRSFHSCAPRTHARPPRPQDLIVFGVGYVVSSQVEKLRQSRSPIIPKWDSPPLTPAGLAAVLLDGDSGPILTEHGLNMVNESWKTRLGALTLRYRALRDAKSKGQIGCWAGMCTPETMISTRDALDEAQWVAEHLEAAVKWCQERKLRKLTLSKLVRARRGARECVRDIRSLPSLSGRR